MLILRKNLRPVFEDLPGPNRAWLLGVYAVTLDPLLCLCGITYVTWCTRLLPEPTRESDSGRFWYTRSRDYQTPTRHALLGHLKQDFRFRHSDQKV